MSVMIPRVIESNVFIKISYFKNCRQLFLTMFLRKGMSTWGKSNLTRQFEHFIARSHDVSRSLSFDVKDDKMRKYFYAMRKMSFKVIFSSHACVFLIELHVKNDFIFPHSPKNKIKLNGHEPRHVQRLMGMRIKFSASHTLNLWNEKKICSVEVNEHLRVRKML